MIAHLWRGSVHLIVFVLYAKLETECFLQTQSISFSIKLHNQQNESISNLFINEISFDLQSMHYCNIGNAYSNEIMQLNKQDEVELGTNAWYFANKIAYISADVNFIYSKKQNLQCQYHSEDLSTTCFTICYTKLFMNKYMRIMLMMTLKLSYVLWIYLSIHCLLMHIVGNIIISIACRNRVSRLVDIFQMCDDLLYGFEQKIGDNVWIFIVAVHSDNTEWNCT